MFNDLTSSVSREDRWNPDHSGDGNVSDTAAKATSSQQKAKPLKPKQPLSDPLEGIDINITKLEEEILSLLIGQERFGLEIIQAFGDISKGRRKLSIGSLYPTLSRLEEKGFVTSRMVDRPPDDKGGARRKYFKITHRGMMVLAEAEQFRRRLSEWQPAT
jgi:PadR family transcriptional regulator PadR